MSATWPSSSTRSAPQHTHSNRFLRRQYAPRRKVSRAETFISVASEWPLTVEASLHHARLRGAGSWSVRCEPYKSNSLVSSTEFFQQDDRRQRRRTSRSSQSTAGAWRQSLCDQQSWPMPMVVVVERMETDVKASQASEKL